MAVARSQIKEVLSVVTSYISGKAARIDMFSDLLETQAARRNASFRETIFRLLAKEEE